MPPNATYSMLACRYQNCHQDVGRRQLSRNAHACCSRCALRSLLLRPRGILSPRPAGSCPRRHRILYLMLLCALITGCQFAGQARTLRRCLADSLYGSAALIVYTALIALKKAAIERVNSIFAEPGHYLPVGIETYTDERQPSASTHDYLLTLTFTGIFSISPSAPLRFIT